MKVARREDMVRGWFVGAFTPSAHFTHAAEVGVKHYSVGESEKRHHHKVATEITLILQGRVRMNGVVYKTGDIITVLPEESADFQVIEDTVTVVVKVPGVLDDKYMGDA